MKCASLDSCAFLIIHCLIQVFTSVVCGGLIGVTTIYGIVTIVSNVLSLDVLKCVGSYSAQHCLVYTVYNKSQNFIFYM